MTPSGRANEDDRSEGNPLFNRRRPDRISLGPISDAYHTVDADFVLSECDRCVLSDQRVFYLHRAARRSYWEPPHAAWQCAFGLPYGYERAVDEFGSIYYINHLDQTTSYEDPRCPTAADPTAASKTATTCNGDGTTNRIIPPVRSYAIARSAKMGFGFVASGELPVVVQFVTPGGPSDGRLLPRDQILSVNGVDVRNESKLKVVDMIRNSSSSLKLEVAQPLRLNENGLKSHVGRKVRFTDRIAVAGSPVECGSLLPLPNVLRVYLENGQTRSLAYDSSTTVQDLLQHLTEKLQVQRSDYFALAVEQAISLAPARLTLLCNSRRVESLAISPTGSRLRCRLRIAFPPHDLVAYSIEDSAGFDYFYQQCVNDFVDGRLVEMRYEASLRLAALHIRQVCMENTAVKRPPPVRRIEKEYGFATFLPTAWLEKIRPRELRDHLQFFLRKDDETFTELEAYIRQPKQRRSVTDGQLKASARSDSADISTALANIVSLADIPRILRIKYVTIVSLLPGFGLKCFSVNYKPIGTNAYLILQVDSRCGVIVRYTGRDSPPAMTVAFSMIENVFTYKSTESDSTGCVCFQLRQSTANAASRNLEFLVDQHEVDDLVAFVLGCAKIYAQQQLGFFETCPPENVCAPPYRGFHLVKPAGWNFTAEVEVNCERLVDFRSGPPSFGQAITTACQEQEAPAVNARPDTSLLPPIGEGRRLSYEASEITVEAAAERPPQPDPTRRRSSQQKFASMLVGTANAILARNRPTTKRIRDSLRVHRQRHSLPNAMIDHMGTGDERRWSSATRRDTIASTGSGLGNPCISRTALLRSSATDRTTPAASNGAGGHLSKPMKSAGPELSARSEPETLPVDRKRTPQESRLLEQLRRSWSLDERKHVRFDFSSTSVILPSPSPNSPEIEEKCLHTVDQIARSFGTLCGSRFGQLSTSRTFPMDAPKSSDFNEDFVPLSYAAAEKKPVNPDKPTVRRMSLKEFTGLENVPKSIVPRHNSAAYHEHTGSPLLGRLHGANKAIVAASSRSTEALNYDQCGARRRSSSALHRLGSNFGSREYVYEPFDRVIDEIAAAVEGINSAIEEEEPPVEAASRLNLAEQLQSIEEARKRLNSMLEKIPTQSPKRRVPVDVERTKILVDIGRLSSAAKRLVRSVYSSITPEERSLNANSVVRHAVLIVSGCEKLLEKRNTYYQAHLLKAELDQLLRTLGETLKDVEEAYDKQRYGPELKRVSRSSNALAASISQTQKAVQTF